jgi:hypothetical protein
MGQYHLAMNLDKREFINPHGIGLGLKQWEQASDRMALVLIAMMSCSNGRGGGDLPVVEGVTGRWAGDRVVFVGDYTEPGDIDYPGIEQVYGLCGADESDLDETDENGDRYYPEGTLPFTDITPMLASFIESAEDGLFVRDGWRNFITNGRYFIWDRDGSSPDGKRHGTVRDIDRTTGGTFSVQWDDGALEFYRRDNAPYLMASDVPGPRMSVDMMVTT